MAPERIEQFREAHRTDTTQQSEDEEGGHLLPRSKERVIDLWKCGIEAVFTHPSLHNVGHHTGNHDRGKTLRRKTSQNDLTGKHHTGQRGIEGRADPSGRARRYQDLDVTCREFFLQLEVPKTLDLGNDFPAVFMVGIFLKTSLICFVNITIDSFDLKSNILR